MRISIIGSGYIGVVTAACLAEKGHTVVCVDIDEEKVRKINDAIPPVFEAQLDRLLRNNVGTHLTSTTNLRAGVIDTDITLICVPTPFDGKAIDLRYVIAAAQEIGKALKDKVGYHVVAVKSTVIPGTTDDVVGPAIENCSNKTVGIDFGLGTNPEFLTEGQAVSDFMNPDRIVLGGADERTRDILGQLYANFGGTPQIRTNNKTAEMIKYASNALLATQISFSNEIANLCSIMGGVDVVDIMRGVHLSHYLSPVTEEGSRLRAPIASFLEAGCGFGGSCLPKDVNALIAHGDSVGAPVPLLKAVIQTNRQQPMQVMRLLKKHFPSLREVRVTILGLSFKPDTDDMRESSAIPIMNNLLAEGAVLYAYDPVANVEARKLYPSHQLALCNSLREVILSAQAIVLVTCWPEFKSVPELLSELNPEAVFIDGRRMLDKTRFLHYEGIGL